MRVLVTGDAGRLGAATRALLEAGGHDVTGFDATRGDDVRDAPAVRAAATGAEAVVHLAGLADDHGAPPEDVMAVNVAGTWNVLLAAAAAGARRVVHVSSGKALGMLERDPAYLPVDDDHPGLPGNAYGLSKWLSEEMCQAFTRSSGVATICLRPVLVLGPERWAGLAGCDELPPASGGAWHLGVFVDLDDTVAAIVAAVTCPAPVGGHARALLCADEVASGRPAIELVREHLPDARWRGAPPGPGSRRALVDCSVAHVLLGWRPAHGWDRRLDYALEGTGSESA